MRYVDNVINKIVIKLCIYQNKSQKQHFYYSVPFVTLKFKFSKIIFLRVEENDSGTFILGKNVVSHVLY